jgi:hypothetical protein
MYQKIKGLLVESQDLAKIQVIEIKRVSSYTSGEGHKKRICQN